MGTNIDHAEVLRSTLRISAENAAKAERLTLPEGHPLDGLTFGEDGYAKLDRFWWYGERSGSLYNDDTLAKFVQLTEGEADIIFTWEGGEFHTGLRIRDGKMKECEVVMALAPEEA